jgi:hypothetical protein
MQNETTTTTTINIETIGYFATSHHLDAFVAKFEEVAEDDDRVSFYNIERRLGSVEVEVVGTVSARVLSTEVIEGSHGTW